MGEKKEAVSSAVRRTSFEGIQRGKSIPEESGLFNNQTVLDQRNFTQLTPDPFLFAEQIFENDLAALDQHLVYRFKQQVLFLILPDICFEIAHPSSPEKLNAAYDPERRSVKKAGSSVGRIFSLDPADDVYMALPSGRLRFLAKAAAFSHIIERSAARPRCSDIDGPRLLDFAC
jgi:hypothetical protein